MSLFQFAEAFTILTRAVTGQDSDGNDVYTPTEVPVAGAFAPEGSTESVQGRDLVTTTPTVYLSDNGTLPKATDQLRREITGEVFELDGRPAVFHNPFTGETPGAVVRLKRVTG